MDRRRSALLVSLSACVLSSCGGGGGGSSPPPPPANAAPTIQNQSFAGTEEQALTGQVTATDVGDTLTYTSVSNPMSGTLTSFTTGGAFAYTPNQNFFGADTFQVRVTDSANQSATATVTLNVAGVDDAPVANNDVLTLTSANSIAVLANDLDVDADPVSVSLVGTAIGGTATVNANRTVTVAVPNSFRGFTKFRYRITDAAGASSEADVVAFIGIEPFKVVLLNMNDGNLPSGVYLNDLITSQLVHDSALSFIQINNIWFARNGRSIVFSHGSVATQDHDIHYVDLANPGQSRLVHPARTGNEKYSAQSLSPDGRYVSFVYWDGTSPYTSQMFLFDANAGGPGTRVSPVDQAVVSPARFNDTGTALVYAGRATADVPSMSAAYRVNIATRAVTRVSPLRNSDADNPPWMTRDDSRIIHERRLAGGKRLLYVNQASSPDNDQLLVGPLAADENTQSPQILSPLGSGFLTSVVSDAGALRRSMFGRPFAPDAGTHVGGGQFTGVVTLFGPRSARPDDGAVLASKYISNEAYLYEVGFNDAANPTTIANMTGREFRGAQYNEDGSRVLYVNRGPGGLADAFVEFRRRSDFATPVTLTETAGAYNFSSDPSGQVALVYINSGTPGLYLYNVDAPQTRLRIGGGTIHADTFAIVPR